MGFSVDQDKCVACAHCWTTYPDLFEQDPDTGKSKPTGNKPPDDATGNQIVGECPQNAITYTPEA